MDCPKCGYKGLLGDECPACGVFASKFLAIQERKKAEEEEKIIEAEEERKREEYIKAELEKVEVVCRKCGKTNFYNQNQHCVQCGEWLYQYTLSDKKELEEYNTSIRCPNCNSTQITAQKQGFGLGNAIAGAALSPFRWPVGFLAGFIRSRKIYLTCLKCGHRFKPGK